MNIILFIFGVVGMTHILVESEIMGPLADQAKTRLPEKLYHGLFECCACSGFWCGAVLGLLLLSTNVFLVFAAGCAGSFLAQLGYWMLDALEAFAKRRPL